MSVPNEAVAMGLNDDTFGGHYIDQKGQTVIMVASATLPLPEPEWPRGVRVRQVKWPLAFLKSEKFGLTAKLSSWNDAGIRARSAGVDVVGNIVLVVVEEAADAELIAADPLAKRMLERGYLAVATADSVRDT